MDRDQHEERLEEDFFVRITAEDGCEPCKLSIATVPVAIVNRKADYLAQANDN
jgi:hypothetical protein